MMKFQRPKKTKEFIDDKKINTARDAVRKAVKAKRKPDFPEHWKAYKGEFAKAQHGKCGYCDHEVASTQAGDVEHFAPKSEVWALGDDPATWGKETTDGLSNIKGRLHDVLFTTGYWWLAYEWENYLFACTVCNSKYKLGHYPIAGTGKRKAPNQKQADKPHLLNCFDSPSPWEEFKFDRLGQIEQRSVGAFETIRTCGLDRETLRSARQPLVEDAYLQCEWILQHPEDAEAITRLLRMGEKRRSFASAVRSIATEMLGVTWSELEAAA